MYRAMILHLEDEPVWTDIVRDLLGDKYDVYSASSVGQAAELFNEFAAQGLHFDLAVVDISMVDSDRTDTQGFTFIDALESSGVLSGGNIIVLTGLADIQDNERKAFRDFRVVDVFKKQTIGEDAAEESRFRQTVDETIELNRLQRRHG